MTAAGRYWQAGLGLGLLLIGGSGIAHEPWILQPDELDAALAGAKPAIFTHFGPLNLTMIGLFLIFCLGWIRLGFTGARELFPDLQARLAAQGDKVAPIIRLCLVWTLCSAAIGLEPRVGVSAFHSPTLVAADLELSTLAGHWHLLREIQLVLAVGLFFGIYVRLFAALLIGLCGVAFYLFGLAFLPYAGALFGCAMYLLLQGSGAYAVAWPAPSSFRRAQRWLANQPRSRAQFIMRVATGLSVLYAGVVFKVLQPQLIHLILTTYPVPIMSAAPEFFTLAMALVEVAAGILFIAGVLLRPLSLFFLAAFIGFAIVLPESFMAHSMFYGVMASFIINGAGHWHRPVARDKAAKIVVVGGGIAATRVARRIEQLAGRYTRVEITLIHHNHNLQLRPLLPEVLAGSMQPGNVVNPLRRICPQTQVIIGYPMHLNADAQTVRIEHHNDALSDIPFDHLVLAYSPMPDQTCIRGLISHGTPLETVGDALQLRQAIIDKVYAAQVSDDDEERRQLLTFVVLGDGQRAASAAMALSQLLRTAKSDFPVLRLLRPRILMITGNAHMVTMFEAQIAERRNRLLYNFGIELVTQPGGVDLVTDGAVFLGSQKIQCSVIVNALYRLPRLPTSDGEMRWPLAQGADLSLDDYPGVWVAGLRSTSGRPHFFTSGDLARLGSDVGYNVWAASQGHPTRPVKLRASSLIPYNMGRRSIYAIGPVVFHGTLAWVLSRFHALRTAPGLERNLRVIIDWILDIPFRSDVAVLTTERSQRLSRARFEAGADVVVQGEEGDCAYIIESGEVCVYVDGKPVATLSEGDCFGEVALIADGLRTATVTCTKETRTLIIGREDMRTLAAGRGVIGRALRDQVRERDNSEVADPTPQAS